MALGSTAHLELGLLISLYHSTSRPLTSRAFLSKIVAKNEKIKGQIVLEPGTEPG